MSRKGIKCYLFHTGKEPGSHIHNAVYEKANALPLLFLIRNVWQAKKENLWGGVCGSKGFSAKAAWQLGGGYGVAVVVCFRNNKKGLFQRFCFEASQWELSQVSVVAGMHFSDDSAIRVEGAGMNLGLGKRLLFEHDAIFLLLLILSESGEASESGENGKVGESGWNVGEWVFDYNTPGLDGLEGAHFLLQDITVENSTGPGTQAVALYCHAEYAIFYKCKITGYQDTLFADSTQQFYRECDIFGTVHFIFGDARALFQNCNLFAHDTGAVFTAHSRDSLKETSGYVIQNCSLKASPEIATNVATNAYLGRPWRKFSTVIVMESFIDAIFNPLGWEPMGDSHGELLTYREYNNRGGGANVTGRVKCVGG
ncbi:pectinesterase-like [Rhododendron vialii]|uniref:pectinesterase-like n=1 Tax=Rhododendron vialii TaxID=182163 RepID=UPI00265D71B4|nr:pectinesterase-like [Rhododendron vialii]